MMVARLVRGIGANALAQLAMLVVQLMLVPVMATRWGLERYGTWILLSSVPSYLSLSDFGFATAAASDMTMKVARGDRAGALVTFQSAWALIVAVSAVLAAVLLGLALLVPAAWVPSSAAAGPSEIRATLLILVLFALVCLQGSITQAGFQCAGRYAVGITLSAVTALVEGVAAVTIVVLGGSLVAVASSYLACRVASLVVQAAVLKRAVPWLGFGWRHGSRAEVRALWRPAVAVMALPLAQSIFLQGTTVVIGLAASPAAVPAFTAVRTLTRTGLQLATMINHAIMPEMAGAVAVQDERLQARIVAITLAASAAAVLPLGIGILLLGHWFVGVWTHGAIVPSMALIAVMTLVMMLQGFWVPLSNLLLAANRHGSYSYVFLAASAAFTALAYPMALWAGAVGAGLALLGLDCFMAWHMIRTVSARLIGWGALARAAPRPGDLLGRLGSRPGGGRPALRN